MSRCGHLDHHDIQTCEMRSRAEGTTTISANATRRCATKCCYFCGGAKGMCQHGCARGGQVCVPEEIIQSGWDLLLQRGWFIYFLWGCFIVTEVPWYPENLSNIFGVLHFHVFPRFSDEHENCPNTSGVSGTSSWICKFLNMQSCLS